MVGVNTFLEASTIHGLNYISTTKKYARLFWIIVVVAGFGTAGYMIKTSFVDWAANPIRTTLETVPISKIKFPKVTVCPPENTYTDLNYDLMVAENATLTEEMRDELVNYSEKVIVEHVYMDDFDILQEENRFYNWYHGYTKISRPFTNEKGLNFILQTTATSGSVNTEYFGEQYQSHLVKRNVKYYVYVYPPVSVRTNPNVTLHFKVEKLSMTGMSVGWDNVVIGSGSGSGSNLDAGLSSATFNFTPPAESADSRWICLTRNNITIEEIKTMDMESMPGFKVSWYYTGLGNEMPTNFNVIEKEEELFRAFINLVQRLDAQKAWLYVKTARNLFLNSYNESESDCTHLLPNEDMRKNVKVLMLLLNITTAPAHKNKLAKDIINDGAKMFLFLNSCPNTQKKKKLFSFFKQVFKKVMYEPTKSGMIIYTLKAIKEKSNDGRTIASKILEGVASILKLPYAPSKKGFKVLNKDAASSFNDFSSFKGNSCF